MIILFINATTLICGSHIETNKTVATSKKYQGFNVASVLLRFESRGMFLGNNCRKGLLSFFDCIIIFSRRTVETVHFTVP